MLAAAVRVHGLSVSMYVRKQRGSFYTLSILLQHSMTFFLIRPKLLDSDFQFPLSLGLEPSLLGPFPSVFYLEQEF